MTRSKIEWTDRTWNPVTGCTKVSPGCEHCYAENIARRFAGSKAFPHGFEVTLRPDRLGDPLRWQTPSRVFVNSMSDLFHSDIPDEFIARVWATMAATPQHTYQILTKRHGRMRSFLRDRDLGQWVDDLVGELLDGTSFSLEYTWPLPNVWLGVSVEDQQRADLRIPALIDTPAAVRFLSCEPLLGPLDLYPYLHHDWGERWPRDELHWVIVGGESGAGARPMHPAWALDLRDQCTAADVAFFFKQWGNWIADARWSGDPPTAWLNETGELVEEEQALRGGSWLGVHRVGKGAAGRILDGRTWDEFPGGPR